MTLEHKDPLDNLLVEVGESVALIEADPTAAFERLIANQRRLIAHLPESAPIEEFESALGVSGYVHESEFFTHAELDARANAIFNQ